VRPVLCPGLSVLRRDSANLQIGVDRRRAVVVEDCPPVRAVLGALDGVRRADEVVDAAASTGIDRRAAIATLRALTQWGVLADADELVSCAGPSDSAHAVQTQPDLSALSLLVAAPGSSGAGRLGALSSRRRRACVAIHGLAGVGGVAARLLGAAGIGQLLLSDDPRRAAVCAQLRRDAPWTATADLTADSFPDVMLLAPYSGSVACEADRELAAGLMRGGVAHCVALVRETTGVLGPFVLPGITPCLRCLDLTRAEADPAWPALLAQLVAAGRSAPPSAPAADSTLTALIGAWATAELLAYISGLATATTGATVEIPLTHPVPERREWAVHPGCGCGWHRAATMAG